MRLTDLAAKRVGIWGAGREGVAAAQALLSADAASVVAVDENPDVDRDAWARVTNGVPLEFGEKSKVLSAQDVVVVSPGVPKVHPWRQLLAARGVKLTSGTALWMAEHHGHTIGVTGTKGKSTTSALIHHLLVSAGYEANLAGNIGTPLLGVEEQSWHVVELSSHQTSTLDISPHVAVVTSLFPEHYDWHGSEEAYYADKLNILAHNPAKIVLNGLDGNLLRRVAAYVSPARVISVGNTSSYHLNEGWVWRRDEKILPVDAIPIPGAHNARNLCLALAALDTLGVSLEDADLPEIVKTFRGLPHRLEMIADPREELTFVNDSLSTAPQSAMAALDAYPDMPVTLIVGGNDRGLDYAPLRDHIAQRAAPTYVLAIPDSGPRIASVLGKLPAVKVEVLDDLAMAVRRARDVTPKEGVVLLSPAAPSYGRFRDHAHRAAVFIEAVHDEEASE